MSRLQLYISEVHYNDGKIGGAQALTEGKIDVGHDGTVNKFADELTNLALG